MTIGKIDAKVYAMINDLTRPALIELLNIAADPTQTADYLRSTIRQQYETGQIPEYEIVATWETDDHPEY